jgi:hypothetical protein
MSEGRQHLKLEALQAARAVLADPESTSQARVSAARLINDLANELPVDNDLQDMTLDQLRAKKAELSTPRQGSGTAKSPRHQ